MAGNRGTVGRAKARHRSRGRAWWTAVAIGAVLLAGVYAAARGLGYVGGSLSGGAQVAALQVTPSTYDLGTVSQAKGLVTVEMKVANAGARELVINEMETSCGCTRAAIVTGGAPGPWFGMKGHGEWPAGWSARLGPGEEATLRVQYDPDAHGPYRGPIDRLVVIYSNDPRQPQARVRLQGQQVE